MSRYDYFDYPPYIPVAQKAAQNRKAVDALRRKNPNVHPVVIEGRTIASSWWGKSWNDNLERYADYSNRIGRGRSYVRHGAVLDLQVEHGRVSALVQGSQSKPYKVSVTVQELPAATWERLKERSLDQVDTLGDLLAGKFPTALKETFFAQGTGLFPSPAEIRFDCSCPDWASMCKHVAAVLYGIGNRLDHSPELLFTLRGVTVDDLIARTVDAAAADLIGRAELVADGDVLADADLGDVFGIELEDAPLPAPEPPAAKRKAPAAKAKPERKPKAPAAKAKPEKKPKAPAARAKPATAKAEKKPSAGKRKAPKQTIVAEKPVRGRMVEQFVEAVGLLPTLFGTGELNRLLPNWTPMQVANTLQRAIQEKRIQRVRSGAYRLP